MDQQVDENNPILDLSRDLLTPENALKCLTGQLPDAQIPIPNARPCNNLDEYLLKSTIGSSKKNASSSEKQQQNSQTPSSSKDSPQERPRKPFAVPLVRNFDKILKKPTTTSQEASTSNTKEPIFGMVYRPRKKRPDIFTKTEELDSKAGPLLLLKNRLEQSIKVLIRRRRKVPYISRVIEYKGTLTLFDKHMNLYMTDVVESFSYKGEDDNIYKRARHRDKLLLRGDNIILIS